MAIFFVYVICHTTLLYTEKTSTNVVELLVLLCVVLWQAFLLFMTYIKGFGFGGA